MTFQSFKLLSELVGTTVPRSGSLPIGSEIFIAGDGILRSQRLASTQQRQTSDTFGYKWHRRDTFESEAVLGHVRAWLNQRYGDPESYEWLAGDAVVLDAGCGAGMSGLEYFGERLRRLRYVGADISVAVDAARDRFAERGMPGEFIQCDLNALPFKPESVDVIFSEGVLHHTDSTRAALLGLTPLLKTGGRFMFYVYKKKGPIREFTDDFIRDKLQSLPPAEAWEAIVPLTQLGKALGELNISVDVPQPIELLQIPAGRIDVQRLFYWHIFKAFYRSDMTIDEMAHINFDWYAPKNAHRQTPEEVRAWCNEAGLEVEREVVEEAGITVVATKTATMRSNP
jgi:ubiquinone/menaquinone biosynthesis C-methylase UbiE